MKTVLIWLVLILVATAVALFVWRTIDYRWNAQVMSALRAASTQSVYSPTLVADQPEPVRRYFNHAIAPGTVLAPAVRLELEGTFDMGTQDVPHHRAMFATQVINYPQGFVWQVVLRTDETWLSGSDGAYEGYSWSRFWLMGLFPVARAGGNDAHYKSAFGRYAAEAVFWTPASVLPGPNAIWSAPAPDLVRVTLSEGELSITVDLTIDEDGQPVKVAFDRWTDANPEGVFRLQRFGGYLSEPEVFDGYTLPTRVVAGNHFETDAYFPFYDAKVVHVKFSVE